jgi:hypothetical protein
MEIIAESVNGGFDKYNSSVKPSAEIIVDSMNERGYAFWSENNDYYEEYTYS